MMVRHSTIDKSVMSYANTIYWYTFRDAYQCDYIYVVEHDSTMMYLTMS